MSTYHNHIGDDLILLIKKGDELAFAAFCDMYRSYLFLKANKRLQHEAAAKDVVQDIFIWIWEHRREIDVLKGVQAYLNGAVHNKTSELIRRKIARRRREQQYAEEQQQIVQITPILERKELSLQLKAAILDISPASRRAFVMSYLEDKSLKEIAGEMGINVQSVKNHIHRALKQLRKKLPKK
jgi:RNA polymerase sigma-70 factor (ECF subfamily)